MVEGVQRVEVVEVVKDVQVVQSASGIRVRVAVKFAKDLIFSWHAFGHLGVSGFLG